MAQIHYKHRECGMVAFVGVEVVGRSPLFVWKCVARQYKLERGEILPPICSQHVAGNYQLHRGTVVLDH